MIFNIYKVSIIMTLLIASCARQPEYDLIIRGGLIVDGTGSSAIKADVAIHQGRFVEVGEVSAKGIREIDASGRYVTPGWIDSMDQSGRVLLKNGLAENKVLMGVTSAIGGEGGFPVSADKIDDYFNTLKEQGISINFGSYYNISQARKLVVGGRDVEVTNEQLDVMRNQMRIAMEAGAVGMSSAAFYPPASFVRTYELVELSKVVAQYNGIYAAHMRDESAKLLDSIAEMITVGEQSGVDIHIFHLKNAYAPGWGVTTKKAIDMVELAQTKGVRISADQYPYVAGGTGIDATVPKHLFSDGYKSALEKLADPAIREQLKKEILDPNSDRMVNSGGGWQNIVLANAKNPQYEKFHGMNFEDIGAALGVDPADAAWDIMIAAVPERAYALYFVMTEDDVQTIMKRPWVSIGSDAGAAENLGEMDGLGLPHPRSYGTFPRILAKYVREDGVLTLEDAIRKMTSLPATDMKLTSRGVIAAGNWADVVIFDYENIQDTATWDDALQTPTGIDYVLVNGIVVVENGKHTGETPGQILYGPGHVMHERK